MRRKENQNEEYNAFFYNIVTIGSEEVKYNLKRQKAFIN
jgi:hypothetical protein